MTTSASPAPANAPTVRLPFPPAFYLSLVATLFFALSVTILIPIAPLYVTDKLHMSESWVGTATMAVSLAAVLSRIPSGTYSDQKGRRRVMVIGAALSIVAGALYLIPGGIVTLIAARMTTGVSLALFTTVNKALAVDLAPPGRRGEALGLNNASFSIALILSPLLGEGLKNAFSFEVVFAVSGLMALVAFGLSLMLPHDKPIGATSHGARHDTRATLSRRGTWAALAAFTGLASIFAVMITFYPLMAERKALFAAAPDLLSSVAMGFGLSIWALFDTVGEPLAGRLSDRFGRQPVFVPGMALTLIGLIALSRASTTYPVYGTIALMAFGWGMARAAVEGIAQDAVSPAQRGISSAILYTYYDIVVGFNAQFLSLLIAGDDFSAMFWAVIGLMAILGIAALLLAIRLVPHEQRDTYPAPG